MLLDLLDGKKKKGFFSRKFAKLRGKNKKKDEDKEKQDKKGSKKAAKEMEKIKKKNKEATRQAMKEAMGEATGDSPKGEKDIKDMMKGRDRRESVADKMLTKQMVKYQARFGMKKTSENSPEL
jgi:hypothetical protein